MECQQAAINSLTFIESDLPASQEAFIYTEWTHSTTRHRVQRSLAVMEISLALHLFPS